MTLCTAIMPTRGRVSLAAIALECFMAQSYESKELVILDDPELPSFPNGVEHPLVRYHRKPGRLIGARRNACCELAQGGIIQHWDSDDWYAPERMAYQVARLEQSGKAVTGYRNLLFYVEPDRAHHYRGSSHAAVGTSLCFRRDWWKTHPFRDNKQREDYDFKETARVANQLDIDPGNDMIVARVHADNTAPKHAVMSNHPAVPLSRLPEAFLATLRATALV